MKRFIKKMIMFLCIFALLTGCGLNENENQSEQNNSEYESNTNENVDKEESEKTEITEDSEEVQDTEVVVNSEELEVEKILYATADVNIRSLPSTSGDKLGVLTKNQEVIGLGEAVDGWQKIRFNDGIAYVSASYLSASKVQESATTETQTQVDEITADDLVLPADFDPNGIVVVIDPGHQGKWNSGKEPDGPGSSTMKTKVSAGATGCVTNQKEYVLNLAVSLKLKEELQSRGYQVVMIRETHSINISNSERAKFANKIGADAFIRIHANSSDNSSVSGVETICQTAGNPYNASIYEECRKLSDCILDEFVESTGAKKRRVWETDTMSGINWCQVPVTILEMGFLSNPNEDELMASDDYQNKMVEGIANGIDKYFGR